MTGVTLKFMLGLAFRNLWRNSRRTWVVLFTVALGSGSLFLLSGFNHGIMNQYKNNTIHSRYGHGQVNQVGYREHVFEKPWEHWIEDWPLLQNKMKEISGVKFIFPRIEFFGLLTNGKVSVSGRGQGIDGVQESQFFTTLNTIEGAALSHQVDGIYLGRGLAQALGVKVGDRVTVLANTVYGSMNGADFTVVGVFHTGAKEFDDSVFRVPLAQVSRLLDTERVESIAIGLESEADWPLFVKQIQEHWPQLETTPFATLDKIYYQNSVDWLKSQYSVIRVIILTIVILGIFNTISASILERKQEIGNLRANGESVWDVGLLFVYEGLILGLLGSALGLVIAFGIERIFLSEGILMPPAPGLTRQFHVKIEFESAMAVSAFVLGSVTTLLATLGGATKASCSTISESLRSS